MSQHEIYREAVRKAFKFLKDSATIHEAYLRAIPIQKIGFLLPVSNFHANDSVFLQKLTDWRNSNVEVFPTQFVATLESTKLWLTNNLLGVSDRILFLVVDCSGYIVGHIGFNNCFNKDCLFEIDNVIRGAPR